MEVEVEVMKDVSEDPYFKVMFSCKTDSVYIKRGHAEVYRESPKAKIKLDSNSIQKLDNNCIVKLELEILNAVIGYIFNLGVSRSFRGNIVICN